MPSSSTSPSQAPYSAKDSTPFQATAQSMPISDCVMVCSSTLSAKPVTHLRKWRYPGLVQPGEQRWTRSCQRAQICVTSMLHLPCACQPYLFPADKVATGGAFVKPPNNSAGAGWPKTPKKSGKLVFNRVCQFPTLVQAKDFK